MHSIIDSLEEENFSEGQTVDPYYKVEKKDSDEKHTWLKTVKDALVRQASTRTAIQKRNYSAYLGSSSRDRRARDDNYNRPARRLHKLNQIDVNHLFDLTETRVSQMTRIKPNVQVIPTNDEWTDKASSIVAKSVIDHLWYVNNIDFLQQQMHRLARITGEAYLFIEWDPNKGDLEPAYVEARDAGVEQITLPDGTTIDTSKPIKTGDVSYEFEMPWRVMLQRKCKIEDVEYYIRVHLKETEKLKDKYPKQAGKIKETQKVEIFDEDQGESKFLERHSVVFEFIHVKTEDVPNGKRILFTDSCILEEGDHPFVHGGHTFVRLTDLDVPDVLNGVSRYRFILPLQHTYNNLTNLILKNIYLVAHAKWVMPMGACRIEQLGNDNTIVQYKGPVAPQLVNTGANSREVYDFRQLLKEEMQTIYGSHGISRGEIPKGITAASALQFLNELENERATTDIAKHGFLVQELAKKTLAIIGEKYSPDDGRLIRIVGDNNKYFIRAFDSSHLHKAYDVRVETSTGLPESKSAKIQRTLEAMQRNPQMLSPERWSDLLELGEDKKAMSLIAEATRAADSENEDLLSGNDVRPPEDWEDHIQHWESHVSRMQERSFKEDVDSEYQSRFREHVYWTEELMLEKSRTNPEFQARLATLKLFPLFEHANSMIPQSREQKEAVVQGQANRGEELTDQIPGDVQEAVQENQISPARRR